jgi:hypothetical protein
MLLVPLEFGTVEETHWGCRVTFNDGAQTNSVPHFHDHHYFVISHRCGYGDDVQKYCVEHDFAHMFISQHILQTHSQVLRALADFSPVPPAVAAYEEAMAQMFQRWLRASEEPIIGGIDWHHMKWEALKLLE